MHKHLLLTIISLTTSAALAVGCGAAPEESASGEEDEVMSAAAEAALSSGDKAVLRGAALFLAPVPGTNGNGRACATCHIPGAAFQLSPAHVEARWQLLQKARKRFPRADDPLFRAIDSDDPSAANPTYNRLRQTALVRVKIKLPTDAQGNKLVWPVDDPNATEVEVFRSTTTIKDVAFTAPYQLDGRAATLQEQALGALTGHAETTVAPKPSFLDDLAAFQKSQFSSSRVRPIASGQPPIDPPLTALEAAGKQSFDFHCGTCHGGPTQTQPLPPFAELQDILTSRPLPPGAEAFAFAPAPDLPVRMWAVRGDDTFPRPSTDPGKALISGRASDFNAFDIPSLYGIAKTAPYFHDNSAATLEQVVLHYQAIPRFFASVLPPGVPGPPQILDSEIAPLVAYLQKL